MKGWHPDGTLWRGSGWACLREASASLLHEEPRNSNRGRHTQRSGSQRCVFISTQPCAHMDTGGSSKCLHTPLITLETPSILVHTLSGACSHPCSDAVLQRFSMLIIIQGRGKQLRRWLSWQRACHTSMRS